MRHLLLLALFAGVLLVMPGSASAATCADHSTQAEAQRAADTRDGDGDGRYCESLPCPCSSAAGTTAPPPPPPPPPPSTSSCTRPAGIQRLLFSAAKYPNIRSHSASAIAAGWPRILVVNRPGKGERRERLLQNIPTKPGFDRDEYPPAVGRGRAYNNQRGLVRGADPIGWVADVMYVPSGENRSHGASLGNKLRRFCNGTRFRYAFG
jgi:hypothetical protein